MFKVRQGHIHKHTYSNTHTQTDKHRHIQTHRHSYTCTDTHTHTLYIQILDTFLPMLDVLHWLPFQHRILFRISALVSRCLLGLAPAYLRDLCYVTLDTRGCNSLRSMERGYSLSLLPVLQLARLVHSRWLALLCGVGFHWHCDCSNGSLRHILLYSLKTALFSRTRVGSASE